MEQSVKPTVYSLDRVALRESMVLSPGPGAGRGRVVLVSGSM